MATLPLQTALRVATYDLVQVTKNGEQLRELMEEVLKNPLVAKDQEFAAKFLASLVPKDPKGFIQAIRVFFKAIRGVAGKEALGLNQKVLLEQDLKVRRPLFELQCPNIPRNFNHASLFAEISHTALVEIQEYLKTGTKSFSPDYILDIRRFALLTGCEGLLDETEAQICQILGDEQLVNVWNFALTYDDRRLKAALLVNNPPRQTPQECKVRKRRIHHSLIEAQVDEYIHLSKEWGKARRKELVPENDLVVSRDKVTLRCCSFLTLNYLIKVLQEGIVREVECDCNDPALAMDLATILKIYGSTLTSFSLTTTTEQVIEALLPDVIRSTGVQVISLKTDEGLDTSFSAISDALIKNRSLQSLNICCQDVTKRAVTALLLVLARNNCALKELTLSELDDGNDFPTVMNDPDIAQLFIEVLRKNTVLQSIHFNDFIWFRAFMEKIAEALRENRSLVSVNLPLELNGNAWKVAKALAENTRLKYLALKLESNNGGHEEVFFNHLSRAPIHRLDLEVQNRVPPVITGLSRLLQINSTLQILDLSRVSCLRNDEAIKLLEGVQRNSTLRHLTIAPRYTKFIFQALNHLLRSHPLERLIVKKRMFLVPESEAEEVFDDEKIKALVEGMQEFPSLIELVINPHELTLEGLTYLADQLRNNQTLMVVELVPSEPDEGVPKSQVDAVFSPIGFESIPGTWKYKRKSL